MPFKINSKAAEKLFPTSIFRFMYKLNSENKFIDVSDYGRPIANFMAEKLKSTKVTAIHITLLFGLSGLIAIYCIATVHYWAAGFFLILKSVLDAVDGQLARAKAQPSFTGRYLDSIFDSLLNILLCLTLSLFTKSPIFLGLLAFICMQIQGTIYNYYYVILRHSTDGEITSQIFETYVPIAHDDEQQKTVNFLFRVYRILYRPFDSLIYRLDPIASKGPILPKWFMTLVSFYGLGFQLLIMAIFLAIGWIQFIIPFFIIYSIFIPCIIAIRRKIL